MNLEVQEQCFDNFPEWSFEPLDGSLLAWMSEVCSFLQNRCEARFDVVVCGQAWNVDVQFDLLSILPELPGVLCSFMKIEPVETRLSFFEQGVERDLVFTPNGHLHTSISCTGVGCKKSSESSVTIDRIVISSELHNLMHGVASVVLQLSNNGLPLHPDFYRWASRVVI